MSRAAGTSTTTTYGHAQGDGSTRGGLVSKSTFGPGNEQPLPYEAATTGLEVFQGNVSAWASGATDTLSAVAAIADATERRRMSRMFMVDLLVCRRGCVLTRTTLLRDACGFLVVRDARDQRGQTVETIRDSPQHGDAVSDHDGVGSIRSQ